MDNASAYPYQITLPWAQAEPASNKPAISILRVSAINGTGAIEDALNLYVGHLTIFLLSSVQRKPVAMNH